MSKNGFVIVSYYTLGTPYVAVAHRHLMASVAALGLKCDIRGVENLGSWQKNTSFKPEFVRRMLDAHPENIVFVDCDAEISEIPGLFSDVPEDCDFACHFLDRGAWYGNVLDTEKELLSGTLFVRNNERARKVIDQWVELCDKIPNAWEQTLLYHILKRDKVKVHDLPLSYCYITSLPDGSAPLVKCESPVIRHHQASRLLKREIC